MIEKIILAIAAALTVGRIVFALRNRSPCPECERLPKGEVCDKCAQW